MNFAHVLRDQGVSCQAYISQISYLLFLKMDEERVTQIGGASMLPDGARWSDIRDLSGEKLNATYVCSTNCRIIRARPQVSLKELAKANGLLV